MKKGRIIKFIIFGVLFLVGIILYMIPESVNIRFYNDSNGLRNMASLYGHDLRLIFLGFILIITSVVGIFLELYKPKKE